MTDGLFTPHSHPSTWEAEAKALRARVEAFEAALKGMVGGQIYAPGLGMIESNESRTARAALQQEGET
jgi:hypothetical protein